MDLTICMGHLRGIYERRSDIKIIWHGQGASGHRRLCYVGVPMFFSIYIMEAYVVFITDLI